MGNKALADADAAKAQSTPRGQSDSYGLNGTLAEAPANEPVISEAPTKCQSLSIPPSLPRVLVKAARQFFLPLRDISLEV